MGKPTQQLINFLALMYITCTETVQHQKKNKVEAPKYLWEKQQKIKLLNRLNHNSSVSWSKYANFKFNI